MLLLDPMIWGERAKEDESMFDLFKSATLQDLHREASCCHSKLLSLLFCEAKMHIRGPKLVTLLGNGEGCGIVPFAGPNPKGRKPHQAGWKERSMKGMRAVADPSPQQQPVPGEQQQRPRYVGLKKTLELDDDGEGNRWRAHEYTPLLPSDDGTDKLVPADISLRVVFKDESPPPSPSSSLSPSLSPSPSPSSSSSSKRSRKGTPKDGPKKAAPKKSHACMEPDEQSTCQSHY